MKKLIPLSLLSLTLLAASPVIAENAIPTLVPLKATQMKDLREQFQAKLAALKDEKKKAIVARMDQLLNQLNTRRTAIMLRHLDTIEKVLVKLQARIGDFQKDGRLGLSKDMADADAAAIKAREAIATARKIVQAQAAKTYTINITTEAGLGASVSTARLALARDLQKAHQSIVAARKAVRAVLTLVSRIAGEKLENVMEEK